MTDEERLDMIDNLLGPGRKLLLRKSTSGRGIRLHESSFGFPDVRTAIDWWAKAVNYKPPAQEPRAGTRWATTVALVTLFLLTALTVAALVAAVVLSSPSADVTAKEVSYLHVPSTGDSFSYPAAACRTGAAPLPSWRRAGLGRSSHQEIHPHDEGRSSLSHIGATGAMCGPGRVVHLARKRTQGADRVSNLLARWQQRGSSKTSGFTTRQEVASETPGRESSEGRASNPTSRARKPGGASPAVAVQDRPQNTRSFSNLLAVAWETTLIRNQTVAVLEPDRLSAVICLRVVAGNNGYSAIRRGAWSTVASNPHAEVLS